MSTLQSFRAVYRLTKKMSWLMSSPCWEQGPNMHSIRGFIRCSTRQISKMCSQWPYSSSGGRGTDSILPGPRLDAWFYLLARNLAIDLLRRKSRSLEFNAMPLPSASLASQPGESSSIESAARRALKSDLQLALLKLSEDDQRILLSDKSSRELSSELGISEASVRVRRFRLLKRLKLMLQEMEHSSSRSSSADSTQRSINVHR